MVTGGPMSEVNANYLYLDNAASTHPKPPGVYSAVEEALRIGANPGRSGHVAALEAARLIHDTRESVARLIGVGDCSRIIFTMNATHGLNQGLFGYLKEGDHVISSTVEHNSVLRPLHELGKRGVEVELLQGDSDGLVDPVMVEGAIKSNTVMVALGHASNVGGAILDVQAVGKICRSHGIAFLLDGSQTVGCLEIDVDGLGVDLLVAPGHKGMLGPQGTGFLYVAPGITLEPLLFGGTGAASSKAEMPDDMPEHLEAGTLNTPGLAGLGVGLEYIFERRVSDIRAGEEAIIARLLPQLEEIERLKVYGIRDPSRRIGVVSFNFEEVDAAHVGYALDEAFSIAVRVGLHCAPGAHKALGSYPAGTVRASFGPYNTIDDADRLVEALKRIAKL